MFFSILGPSIFLLYVLSLFGFTFSLSLAFVFYFGCSVFSAFNFMCYLLVTFFSVFVMVVSLFDFLPSLSLLHSYLNSYLQIQVFEDVSITIHKFHRLPKVERENSLSDTF